MSSREELVNSIDSDKLLQSILACHEKYPDEKILAVNYFSGIKAVIEKEKFEKPLHELGIRLWIYYEKKNLEPYEVVPLHG